MLPAANPVNGAIPDQITDHQLLQKYAASVSPSAIGVRSSSAVGLKLIHDKGPQTVQMCEPLALNPRVGPSGNMGAFCPLHQTSVVFIQS